MTKTVSNICPKCENTNEFILFGKMPDGRQKLKCKKCQSVFIKEELKKNGRKIGIKENLVFEKFKELILKKKTNDIISELKISRDTFYRWKKLIQEKKPERINASNLMLLEKFEEENPDVAEKLKVFRKL